MRKAKQTQPGSKAVEGWAAIRDDVRTIRQAVLGIESTLNQTGPKVRASVRVMPGRSAVMPGRSAGLEADPAVKAFNEVAQPRWAGHHAPIARHEHQSTVLMRELAIPQPGGAGSHAVRSDTESTAAVTHAVTEPRTTRQTVTSSPAQPLGRDSRGRFVRGTASAGPTDGERDGRHESALRFLSEGIVDAFKESGAGLEEADPAVKAFNEVAQPMIRGYELLTGGDSQKKQEGWLRRIYGSLTGFRKDEGLFNKVAAQRLKSIEEKPIAEADGGGGSGLFGAPLEMLGSMLKRIVSRGALSRTPIIGALLGGLGLVTSAMTPRQRFNIAAAVTWSASAQMCSAWAKICPKS